MLITSASTEGNSDVFLLIILCSRKCWCNHHVDLPITLLKRVLIERVYVDTLMLYPCNL